MFWEIRMRRILPPWKSSFKQDRQRWGLLVQTNSAEAEGAGADSRVSGWHYGGAGDGGPGARREFWRSSAARPSALERDSRAIPRCCDACLNCWKCADGWRWRRIAVRLTPRGRYAAQIATSYGVTVSYLPLLKVLERASFRQPAHPTVRRKRRGAARGSRHERVGQRRRAQNLFQESGRDRGGDFQPPAGAQPDGICDMGCGDGTFLEHLYS